MNKLTSALHDATHQVPGVPAHRESPLPHQPSPSGRNTHAHLHSLERHNQTLEHHQKPPRALIGWQNWIARHIGQNDHR